MSTIPTMGMQMRIDIYSDTVCPWCFLGKRRFELALGQRPQYEPRVTWRPFELNPELPWEGMERAPYLASKLGDPARVAEMEATLLRHGEAVGLNFHFDRIQRVPNSRRSHLLIALAGRRGLQSEVMDRVMRAYFEEGIDIGEVDELARLGADCGLDEREARSALILRSGQDGVVAAERHASVLGITGIPTYVFDGQYTISGSAGAADPGQDIRPGDGLRRGTGSRFVTPDELTGRVRSHILDLPELGMGLHIHAMAPFLALRREALAAGFDLVAVSSFRDFDRQLGIWNAKFSGAKPLRVSAGNCWWRATWRQRSGWRPSCSGPRSRARAGIIGAPTWISSTAAPSNRAIGCS